MDKYALNSKEEIIAGRDAASIVLEKQLADVLGYVDVELSRSGQLVGRFPGEPTRTYLPRWARDNAAAFELMTRNKLSVGYLGHCEKGERRACSDDQRLYAVVYSSDHHGDEEATARAAIVSAALAKLEHQQLLEANRPSAGTASPAG